MKFPKKTISASFMGAYMSCPYGFYLTAIKGYQPPTTAALLTGSMFDLMFKEFHEGRDYKEAARLKYLVDGDVETTRLFAVARKLMEKYEQNPEFLVKPEFDLRFEIDFENPLTGEKIPDIKLKGFLDGLETLPYIEGIEVKTTGLPYTQQQIDESIQADFYCYYIFTLGVENPRMKYIVFNKKTEEIQVLYTERTKEDLARTFNKVKQFILDVEVERFEKNPNCPFYCPHRSYEKNQRKLRGR